MKAIISILVLSLLIPSFQSATGLVSTISNCAVSYWKDFTTELYCVRCNTGYTVSSGACVPEIDKCYEYDESSVYANAAAGLTTTVYKCKTCVQNFVKTFSGRQCVTPILNCLVHLDTTDSIKKICGQCITGFVPSVGGQTCVKPIANCNQHNAAGNCTEIKGCKTYDLTTSYPKCTECYDDLQITDSKLFCVPLISNCKNYEDDGTCRTCAANSLSVSRRSCLAKDPSCLDINDFGICLKCLNPNFVPAVQRFADCANHPSCPNACVAPKTGCAFYDVSGNCLRCNAPNLILVDSVKRCFPIIPQCSTYNDDGTCSVCVNTYALDKASKATACVPLVTGCTTYDPKTGFCLTCESSHSLIQDFSTVAPIVLKAAYCRTTVTDCVTYDKTTDVCAKCKVLNDVYLGKCYSSVANCATYDDKGCASCKTGFTGFKASDGSAVSSAITLCAPTVLNCKTSNSKGLCSECNDGYKQAGSGKFCIKTVTDCVQYDELRGLGCIKCDASKYLSISGTACGSTNIASCTFVDDADTTKCALCDDLKVLSADRATCSPYAFDSAAAPVGSLIKAGQIIWNAGGSSKTISCLTHNFASTAGSSEIDISATLTGDAIKVAFKNCDEVDYRNTLWQVLKEDGTPITDKSTLLIKDAALQFSFAAYYPGGVDGAFKTKFATFSHTKYQLRLKADSTTNTLSIAWLGYSTFEVKKVTTANSPGQDAFNLPFSLNLRKAATIPSPTSADDALALTGTLGAAPGNNLFATVSTALALTFGATAPAGYFDFRQVNLDATTDNSKPFGLASQVTFSYAVYDDNIVFKWVLGSDITDLYNVFPVLQGDNNIVANDRTVVNSACNSKFGFDDPKSGWSRGFQTGGTIGATFDMPNTQYQQIVFNIPIFDLYTRCGFTWKTLTASSASKPTLDAGGSYLKGRVGVFTGSQLIFYGDGLFDVLYINLNTMKASRNIYVDNPLGYQWYYSGNVKEVNLKFNTQIKFFTSAGAELAGFVNSKDQRLVVPPAASSTSTGLQVELSLVSFVKSDQVPSAQYDDGLDSNIRVYNELKESFTFTSITVKLVRTTGEVDPSAPIKYITTLMTITGTNIKASTTKRNAALFDIDLKSILPGKYDVIVEYLIKPSGRNLPLTRLLHENGKITEIEETPEIKHESQEVSAEDFIGLTGSATPFKLDYQSNFGMKLGALFSFLIVLIFGMI